MLCTMYSSGNTDVRNRVHLFETRCIINVAYFLGAIQLSILRSTFLYVLNNTLHTVLSALQLFAKLFCHPNCLCAMYLIMLITLYLPITYTCVFRLRTVISYFKTLFLCCSVYSKFFFIKFRMNCYTLDQKQQI